MGIADTLHTLDPTTGVFVNEKHRRVAEIINDYDDRLSLVWIPPSDRTTEEDRKAPFAIYYTGTAGEQSYVVRTVKEEEVDERLLAWLWSNDTERNNPLLSLQKAEEAKRIMEAHAAQEARDEAMEIGKTILKSNLHQFKHNGKVYE